MREMARVVTVKEKREIPGKDRIVEGVFEETGYTAIISKDIQVGELVCWIEADSILPVKEEWEFLRKRCYKEELQGFLIKPMKMFGIKSWGLVVTLKEAGLEGRKVKSGDDLTEVLGIRKYEPVEDASPKKKKGKDMADKMMEYKITRWMGVLIKSVRTWWREKNKISIEFPEWIISKSDEDTIQNNPILLEKFKDSEVYVSAKMEGQSVSALFDYDKVKKKVGGFYVCSRNKAYRVIEDNTFWNFAIKNEIERKLREYYKESGKLICIQAEQCGPGIQSNIYNFSKTHWFVYTMKDEVSGEQIEVGEMIELCRRFGLETVPMLTPVLSTTLRNTGVVKETVRLREIMENIDDAVKYAEDKIFKVVRDGDDVRVVELHRMSGDKIWGDVFQHEGIVVRSMDYDKDRGIGFSFKVKNMEYAEKGLAKISECIRKSLVNDDKNNKLEEKKKNIDISQLKFI